MGEYEDIDAEGETELAVVHSKRSRGRPRASRVRTLVPLVCFLVRSRVRRKLMGTDGVQTRAKESDRGGEEDEEEEAGEGLGNG